MSTNIRLTNDLRNKIRASLIGKKFDERIATVQTRKGELAMSIYERVFSPTERRAMNRLPEGWLPKSSNVSARLGTNDFYADFPNKKQMRMPYDKVGKYSSAPSLIAVNADDALAKEAYSLRDEESAIENERNNLRREIDAVLLSVSTANKLVDVWPEARKTVEAVCRTYVATVNLPAPRVEFLNKVLGLSKAA